MDDIARLMGEGETGIAGFYQNRSDGSFAVSNRERTNTKFALSGQTVLFHEYAHHFMFRHLARAYPAWYVEGFAEYFSTIEFDDEGRWKLGKPAYHRARSLLGNERLSLDQLLFGSTEGMPLSQLDLYYGRAWMLVHMAMSNEARGRQMRGYLRDFANGVDPREAAETNFGSLSNLEDDLENYVNESLQYRSSSSPHPYLGRLELRDLDRVASDLVQLRLERRMETDLAETRDALAELAAEAPGRASAWYELAKTELALGRQADRQARRAAGKTVEEDTPEEKAAGDGEPDEETLIEGAAPSAARLAHEQAAEAALDRTLALDPAHVRATVEKARLKMLRLVRAGDKSTHAWSTPRLALLTAHHRDPTDPQPLLAYYESFAEAGVSAPATARDAIRQAFALAPEASRLRMSYVSDLLAHGEVQPAIATLKVLAYSPHDGGGARSLLEELQKQISEREDEPAGSGD